MLNLSPEILKHKDELISIRRHLHQFPELSFEEKATMDFVVERLKSYTINPQYPIANTGVSCLLEGNQKGPTIMLRADMDALPIDEENKTLEFRSKNPGVMHACGHDGHVAMLLITAKILKSRLAHLRGNIKFVFQPAEEKFGGAKLMIQEGVLKNPDVSSCFGLHLSNTMPAGTIGIKSGPFMAATDEFKITVTGSGGHGAYPHFTVDPIVTISQMVTAFQTIIPRNLDPLEHGIISVCSMHAGEAFNVIPKEAYMGGTIRTFSEQNRQLLLQRLQQLGDNICRGMGAEFKFEHFPGYPACVNSRAAALFAKKVARKIFNSGVLDSEASMGGEDMAYYLNEVPGCFIFLGSKNEAKGIINPHHSSNFDFDEDILPAGVEFFVTLVEKYLSEQPDFTSDSGDI
ncbi:M20 family metallopeptidase [Candidatus Riflebacteria bacterium]